ncbi:MAG: DUF1559 domain-containing protein [Abitibacteriaceae bacterium]|nr:DUF1559 domain-containing protein [Abditibacteriaceae bacterium]
MNPDRYVQITENVYLDNQGQAPFYRNGGNAIRLVKGLMISTGLLMLAAIFYPIYLEVQDNARRTGCCNNLMRFGLGMAQYQQDNDGKFPLVAVNDVGYSVDPQVYWAYGWADALYPYLRKRASYICPASNNHRLTEDANGMQAERDPTEVGFTDYWFNRNLSGIAGDKLPNPQWTFLVGDGNTGHDATDARYSLSALPARWRDDPNSPAHRHGVGLNFCYADGHVHWLNATSAHDQAYNPDSFTLGKAIGD